MIINIYYDIPVSSNPSDAIKDIQDFIDEYKLAHKEIEEDYIHGDDSLVALTKEHNAVGIFMPTINKNGLFDYCFRRGTLPRKSFSMVMQKIKDTILSLKKLNDFANSPFIFLTY